MRLRQGTRNETKSNHVDQPISRFARSFLPSQSPLLAEFLRDIAFKIVSSRLKNRLQKKMSPNRENLARSGGRRDPVLDLQNGSTLASSLKKLFQTKLPDSLNNPIKEHLRLLRSLALSSNCAFGAIKMFSFISGPNQVLCVVFL